MVGSYDQFEVERVADTPQLRTNRSAFGFSWRGFVLGGDPGAYRFVDRDRTVEVQARGFDEHRKRTQGRPFRDPTREPLAEIREGQGIWIDFAADNYETKSFEMLVPRGAFGSLPATDQILRFHQCRDYFWTVAFVPF